MTEPPRVDHLVLGAPDLERGVERAASLLGVRAAAGGRHAAWGTHNALLSLGDGAYLEVLAPDPDRPAGRPVLLALDRLPEPRLVAWAARVDDLEGAAHRMAAAGAAPGAVGSGGRERPDGSVLRWRLTDPGRVLEGGALPFLIDWCDSPHPSASAPRAGTLTALRIEHPRPGVVGRALATLGMVVGADGGRGLEAATPTLEVAEGATPALEVDEAAAPALVARIATPHGPVELR